MHSSTRQQQVLLLFHTGITGKSAFTASRRKALCCPIIVLGHSVVVTYAEAHLQRGPPCPCADSMLLPHLQGCTMACSH
jgi:hypothetical protein